MRLSKNSSIWNKAVIFLFILIFNSYIILVPIKANALVTVLTFLKVVVLDAETNEPIAGAQVDAYVPLYGTHSGQTNQDGVWEIGFVGSCGNYFSITVSKPGYKQFSNPPVLVPCFSRIEITINLEKENTNTVNPVLIIPGIAGSQLFYQGEEIWLNTSKMFTDISDDFLKNLSLDNRGSSLNNIVTGDIIREKMEIFEIWTDLIKDLQSTGYIENQNLFVFPYDWRLDNSHTANLLAGKINNILDITGASKVDIIAHSMGGLIAKQYIKTFGEEKVGKIFFLGTPHYGAPKTLKTLLFGDNFGIPFILNSKSVKDITTNMSSVYQLLPSQYFFDKYNSYLIDFGDADNNGVVGSLSWAQTNDFIQNMNLNSYLNIKAANFHSNIDDWMPSKSLQNRIYNIVGCDRPTLTRLISSTNLKGGVKWQAWLANGDATVPLKSALGKITNNNYFIREAKHSRLPDHLQVRKLIIEILEGKTPNLTAPFYSQISPTEIDCGFSGWLQSVHSPVSVHAYDKNGKHTGPNNQGGIDTEIPGSDYFELGEDKFIYIPAGIEVEYIYRGQEEGSWQLNVQKFEQSTLVKSANFLKLPTAAGMKTTITITPNTKPEQLMLNIDINGDGQTDSLAIPDTILVDNNTQDVTPPQVDIYSPEQNKLYLNDSMLNIDYQILESDSGIISEILKLDGVDIEVKTIALPMLKLGEHKLEVISMDKAGNIGKGGVVFFTSTSLPALKNNIKYYWEQKLITDSKTYRKIKTIFRKIDKSDNKYKRKINKKQKGERKYQNKQTSEIRKRLKQLIRIVNKEKGKTIDNKVAELLIEQTNFILSTLK